jgi:hypothetical protein
MSFEQAIEGFTDERGLSVERIATYLDRGGDINAQWPRDGRCLLHFAAEDMNVEAIRLLASRGADFGLRTFLQGWTPLHLAVDADVDCASNAGLEITLGTVGALIDVGADETLRDDEGNMPRDIAVSYLVHDLYDKVSHLDWSAEPTINDFAERCLRIIRSCEVDVRMTDGFHISGARTAADHSVLGDRFFILASGLYGKRHNDDFEEYLCNCVREGSRRWGHS